MIGLDRLYITPALLNRFRKIDSFAGHWDALDRYTTGLNMIADVSAHGMALKDVLGPLQNKLITADIVKGMHGALCAEEAGAGQWRGEEITLDFEQNGLIMGSLETAEPETAPKILAKLLDWTQGELTKGQDHPLLILAVFTAVFLQVSPFASGNRKLACFLIILFMLKSGYAYAPFASILHPFQERSMQVYEALMAQQLSIEEGQPDWQSWLACFVDILLDQQRALAARMDRSGDEAGQEAADMAALSLALLDVVRAHKRATMKLLIEETRGRRSTIKLRLQELVESGKVKRHGAGRGVWYALA